jgi:hypothetical protein
MKRFRQIFFTAVIFMILFSSLAYGDTWTPIKNLSNDAGNSWHPAIAVDGLNIYVVWEDDEQWSPQDIYFRKSDDGGATWRPKENLTNNAGHSSSPAIAVDGQNIYVAWQDNIPGSDRSDEIYFKKSDDGGTTWTANKRLTNNRVSSGLPAIAINGSNIYVVWQDYRLRNGNYEIYFRKSDDGGATWRPRRQLTYTTDNSLTPAIAVDSLNVYVIWMDYRPGGGNYAIYFKKSVDGGATWTTKRLTWNAGDSLVPAMAVNGSNIYVVWQDYRLRNGNYEIYFRKSDDGGATWRPKENLTNNAGSSERPAIVADDSNICVVWQDSTLGKDDIYLKKSVDEGVTWTTKRLTNNAGNSWYPAIALDDSNIYVVWQDITSGNFEIYFRKGIMD